MNMNDMVTALEAGQKVRRSLWPDGHYVEAEGTGNQRKVAPGTMYYHGDDVVLWVLLPSYDADFTSEDFEVVP